MNELERITEVLDGMDLPDWVVSLSAKLMYDSLGERAVSVRAVIADATLDEASLGRRIGDFRVAVIQTLSAAGIELFPYVGYVAESEAELVG